MREHYFVRREINHSVLGHVLWMLTISKIMKHHVLKYDLWICFVNPWKQKRFAAHIIPKTSIFAADLIVTGFIEAKDIAKKIIQII